MLCPNCKTPVEGNECPKCGTILTELDRLETNVERKPLQRGKHRTSIWYGFLLYYAFFEVAFLNTIQGIRMLTGDFFGSAAAMERLYAEVPGLHALVIFCALLSFAYVGLGLFTRSRLKNYRKSAPWLVLLFYTGDGVIYMSLMLGLAALADVSWTTFADATTMFHVIRSFIMVVCNAVYFDKRKHLFWVP